MKLYVNGDSHSMGHDAGGPEFSYGKHVADQLGMDFICDAIPGCSNDSIIARTQEYLKNNTPDLIVIGWSTWERETWSWAGLEYNITASGADYVPEPLQEKYKQWVIDSCRHDVQQEKEYSNYDKIWQIHCQLKELKIKHLFFNCYSHFFYINAYNKPRHSWDKNYIDPYSKEHTYYFWLEKQGFIPANPKFYHYGPDAHEAWANHLLSYIQQL